MSGFIVSLRYVNNLVYYEEDVQYKIYITALESIKNGLINEILLNISLCGTKISKTIYSSNEYLNKIKNADSVSLMKITKTHKFLRKVFLGAVGSIYENIGYKMNFLPVISKL